MAENDDIKINDKRRFTMSDDSSADKGTAADDGSADEGQDGMSDTGETMDHEPFVSFFSTKSPFSLCRSIPITALPPGMVNTFFMWARSAALCLGFMTKTTATMARVKTAVRYTVSFIFIHPPKVFSSADKQVFPRRKARAGSRQRSDKRSCSPAFW